MSQSINQPLQSRLFDSKECSACLVWKPLSEFYRGSSSRDSIYPRCKGCHNSRVKAYIKTPEGKEARRQTTAKYRQSEKCKAGRKEHDARFRRKPERREYARRWRLAKKYDITLEEYQRMFAEQCGLCAICGQPPACTRNNNHNLAVDHDHETGAIRALLCVDCNVGIANLKEDIAVLQNAIAYLERFGKGNGETRDYT